MQTTILRIVLLITMFFVSLGLSAQVQIKIDRTNYSIENLKKARAEIEKEEKELLKKGIEELQEKLKKGEISVDAFENAKVGLAELHAKNIKSRTLIIDESIDYLKRNDGEGGKTVYLGYRTKKEEEKEYEASDTITRNAPTQKSGMTIGFGFSNLVGDNNINDSPYKIAGSRFFEIGYEWRTTFTQNGPLHLRYGINFQIDGYKPEDNQYFVKENKTLHLEEYPVNLKKSKLRSTNLVVPLHLEFRKVNHKVLKSGKNVYSYRGAWRVGVGGYAGLNLKTVQKLKYKDEHGRQKVKENMSSAVNQAVYGLSAYVGKGSWSVYARYGLNEMFKNTDIKENAIAVGITIKN